jgi:hypothetical protein
MNTTLAEFKKYFQLQELVDKEVYSKYRDTAWQFICPMLIESMLVIRMGLDKPITINNWHLGGRFSQRGLRHNKSAMVVKKRGIYLSAHCLGKAFDFDVSGMSASSVRDWIEENSSAFPYKVRLEDKLNGKQISWVHLDVYQNESNPKIYRFDV